MTSGETRPVTVIVRAAVTDQMMTGYDENGGTYETRVLGHRRFRKVLAFSDQAANPRFEINGHGYCPEANATWSRMNGQVQLEVRLREDDNGPLEDCLADSTWTEVADKRI